MNKITLKLNLTENPEKTSIFNILDTDNKLRPEVIELLETGILKYFQAPVSTLGITVKEHNEHLTLHISGDIEYLKERWQ